MNGDGNLVKCCAYVRLTVNEFIHSLMISAWNVMLTSLTHSLGPKVFGRVDPTHQLQNQLSSLLIWLLPSHRTEEINDDN